MAIDHEAFEQLTQVANTIFSLMTQYKDDLLRNEERLENARLTRERIEIEKEMASQQSKFQKQLSDLTVDYVRLVKTNGIELPDDIIDDVLSNQIYSDDYMDELQTMMKASVPEQENFTNSIINDSVRSQHTDEQIYGRLQEETQARGLAFKDPEMPLPFEFVVLDSIVNSEYPEKNEDIHMLGVMNQGRESIEETLRTEDWPQINAAMNLNVAKYMPEAIKDELSVHWLNSHDYDTVSLNHDQIQDAIQQAHERAVFIDHTAQFYGSASDEADYFDNLRQQLVDREIKNNPILDIHEYESILENTAEIENYSYVSDEQAYKLLTNNCPVYLYESNQIGEQVEYPEQILYAQNHDFVCRHEDIQMAIQLNFEETLDNSNDEDNIFDYRTEIDPTEGLRESLNTLASKRQPTAASVQDELEEDVVYGIGEVGDSNQEAQEEYLIEEELYFDEGR